MLPDTITPALAETSALEGVAAETSSGQSRRAYYIAASMMLVSGLTTLVVIAVTRQTTDLLVTLFDLAVAIALFRLHNSARKLAILRALIGGIGIIFLTFRQYEPAIAVLVSITVVAYSGAIVLLLTGRSQPWRLILAVGIFIIFWLSCYLMGAVGIALGYRV